MAAWRFLLAFVLSFALSSCLGSENSLSSESLDTNEIVRGRADNGRHPEVLALLVNNRMLCTATLIAPRAVLTARHCVSEVPQTYTSCQQDFVIRDYSPNSMEIYSGESLGESTLVARARQIIVPSTRSLCNSDIAIVVLDRSVEGIVPAIVATQSPWIGERTSIVGFGKRGDRGFSGQKRFRSAISITDITRHEITTGQGICQGDSGGPLYDNQSGEVIAVASRGDESCSSPDAINVFTRADTFQALVQRGLMLGR